MWSWARMGLSVQCPPSSGPEGCGDPDEKAGPWKPTQYWEGRHGEEAVCWRSLWRKGRLGHGSALLAGPAAAHLSPSSRVSGGQGCSLRRRLAVWGAHRVCTRPQQRGQGPARNVLGLGGPSVGQISVTAHRGLVTSVSETKPHACHLCPRTSCSLELRTPENEDGRASPWGGGEGRPVLMNVCVTTH